MTLLLSAQGISCNHVAHKWGTPRLMCGWRFYCVILLFCFIVPSVLKSIKFKITLFVYKFVLRYLWFQIICLWVEKELVPVFLFFVSLSFSLSVGMHYKKRRVSNVYVNRIQFAAFMHTVYARLLNIMP